jgi:hypothetical protein
VDGVTIGSLEADGASRRGPTEQALTTSQRVQPTAATWCARALSGSAAESPALTLPVPLA